MKKIITHLNPDLDAVGSVWLVKRFLPGWEKAEVEFVAAGKIASVDDDPDLLYVDVGWGKLDHHQTNKYFSASQLCLAFIFKERKGEAVSPLEKEALGRMVVVINEIDNARDLGWPEAKEGRYKFYLHSLLVGIRSLAGSDQEVISFGLRALDAVLMEMKNKVRAEEELKRGIKFNLPQGKAIALETGNREVLWEGEVQGFCLVVKKDPKSGAVRIYARPDSEIDLTKVYNRVRKADLESDWFLHSSKKLLLNHSSANPNLRPTKLSLEKIIKIFQEERGC